MHTPLQPWKRPLHQPKGSPLGALLRYSAAAGDRDQAKRPIMGTIAAKLADVVIVTSDNPRTEDARAIIDDISSGITDKAHVLVEPDRAEAIKLAVSFMKEGDCLIIAGKGHEDYQIIGRAKKPFDDMVHVRASIKEIFSR